MTSVWLSSRAKQSSRRRRIYLMLDLLNKSSGEQLTRAGFGEDLDNRFASSGSYDSWKLERLQNFSQPGDARWEALARGDWDEAIRLIGERRESLKKLA